MLGSADASCVGENDPESHRVRKAVTAITCSSSASISRSTVVRTLESKSTLVSFDPKKDSVHIANWDGHGAGRCAGSAGGGATVATIHDINI